jgi:hypothetical protein
VKSTTGLIGVGVVLVLVLGVAFPAFDRASRTQEIGGVRSDGAIHVAPDGRIIGVDASGTAFAVDPMRDSIATLVDGLDDPIAADVAADGKACAIDRSAGDGALTLRCSDGHAIAVIRPDPTGESLGSDLGDVIADGRGGWLVADPSGSDVVHIDRAGLQTVAARFESCAELRAPIPVALAIDAGGTVFVGLLEDGVSRLGEDVNQRCGSFQDAGGDDLIAVIPRGSFPIVLTRAIGVELEGALTWHPGLDGETRQILGDLRDPHGAALLPDGRIAISASGRLSIYRPTFLPGS